MGMLQTLKIAGNLSFGNAPSPEPKPINTFRDVCVEVCRSFMPPALAGLADTLTNEQVDKFLVAMEKHGYVATPKHIIAAELHKVSAASPVPMVAATPETADAG